MSERSQGPGAWHRVQGPGITLDVPDEVRPAPGQAGEGGALTLTGQGVTVLLDGSPFADPMSGYAGQPDYERTGDRIAGQPVDLVSFRTADGTRVLGTRFDDVLTAVVHLAPGLSDDIALRVLHSIRPTYDEPGRPAASTPSEQHADPEEYR